MVAEAVKENKKSKARDGYVFSVRGKALVQAALVLCALVLFLAGGFVEYSFNLINIKLGGADVLSGSLYGGNVGYMNYGTVLYLHIPVYITLLGWLCLLAPLACAVYSVLRSFVFKKDNRISGYILLAFGGVCIVAYILLLTCGKIPATDVNGNKTGFYRIFEVKSTFLMFSLLAVFAGFVQLFVKPQTMLKVKRFAVFYIILVIPTVLVLIFNVYPSLLQTVLAFKDYTLSTGIWGSDWVGLSNFKYIFSDGKMLMVIWQTIYLSFLRLLAGTIPAVVFALVFYHITSKKYKAAVQTIVYIPHFFSWVVIYAIISAFLMPNGVINNVITNVFHGTPIDFLSRQDLFYANMILSSIWKEVGWGTILYTASLMGIDRSLFEAASIDGAGFFKKLWHITLPSVVPMLVYQVIMAVGNLLKGAGGEQILIFATSAVKENKALVIDTWLYWEGLQELKYGLSGAVSFVQSVIGFGMVVGAHKLSQKTVGIGAW